MPLFFLAAILSSILFFANPANASATEFKFLGDKVFPTSTVVDGIPFGGISGLAWDDKAKVFLAVSDDRGRVGPPRFYELKVSLNSTQTTDSSKSHLNVQVVKTVILRKPDGQDFTNNSVDFESISINLNGNILIASEPNPTGPVRVFEFTREGLFVKNWPVPTKFQTQYREDGTEASGTRTNLGFEAMRVDLVNKRVLFGTENALVQDGLVAGSRHGSVSRIWSRSLEGSRKTNMERAYFVEPVEGEHSDFTPLTRGLVEFIIFENKYWALERSYVQGIGNNIYLYEFDPNSAADISHLPSLETANYSVISKKLILNFSSIISQLSPEHPRLDNTEAGSVGLLPDGTRFVLFASDNNFNPSQATQFLAFKVK